VRWADKVTPWAHRALASRVTARRPDNLIPGSAATKVVSFLRKSAKPNVRDATQLILYSSSNDTV
jgi:hypothetical protein